MSSSGAEKRPSSDSGNLGQGLAAAEHVGDRAQVGVFARTGGAVLGAGGQEVAAERLQQALVVQHGGQHVERVDALTVDPRAHARTVEQRGDGVPAGAVSGVYEVLFRIERELIF